MMALCCMVLVACQGNEPDKDKGEDDQQKTEIIERLDDLVDGIGKIVDSKTLDDGTIVMTDDNGNSITKDKDGNITIVTKEGEKILIDNSIQEDQISPKDKWFHTKWKNYCAISPEIDLNYRKEEFVQTLRRYGFTVSNVVINKDSIVIVTEQNDDYVLYFKSTTASLRQASVSTKYTYNRTYQLKKYQVEQKTVGDGELRYRFAIEYYEYGSYGANLYEDYYEYNPESDSFVLYDSRQIDGVGLGKDNAIYIDNGYENNSTKEDVLSQSITTTFFNYRRLSDTQIAANNNSISYILKEDPEDDTPELEVYDLEGNHLITFELVSF